MKLINCNITQLDVLLKQQSKQSVSWILAEVQSDGLVQSSKKSKVLAQRAFHYKLNRHNMDSLGGTVIVFQYFSQRAIVVLAEPIVIVYVNLHNNIGALLI